MQVLFIGQNPSAKNTDKSVPFVGTKSYETLKVWMREIGIRQTDEVRYINASNKVGRVNLGDVDVHPLIMALAEGPDKILCLGKYATKALKLSLKQTAIRPPVSFELPHPSPRNRALNSKSYVRRCLRLCKEYLTK